MSVVHVIPVRDLVAHEDDGVDCVCIPEVQYMIGCCGDSGKLVLHHSLDNREAHEVRGGAPQ